MTRLRLVTWLCLSIAAKFVTEPALAQIRVNPTGVSINAMSATTVFLTFGGLQNHTPVEAFWCGEIVPAAAPDRGSRCDPATLYGRLPFRLDRSAASGSSALTDVMSIPASVARRAYQDAQLGKRGTFFYVRRFRRTSDGTDEFVPVTCRLTGGGANVPFSLTNVDLAFASNLPVEFVQSGNAPSPVVARITYNGSGRLRGRWEVVMPGEEQPTPFDLLTEASIPSERRASQKHYAQVERFNVLLPPGSKYELPGPDPGLLPTTADGTYRLLLRVEATDDRAGDSDPGSVGGGNSIVHNGGVAGFSLPTLRYVVGADTRTAGVMGRGLHGVWPREGAAVRPDSLLVRWVAMPSDFSRIEFESFTGEPLFTAIVGSGESFYWVPPQVAPKAAGRPIRWRVSAVNAKGATTKRGLWNTFRIGVADGGA